ncbi:transcriptional regulator [Enterococcus florum]|uniref:Transcriptional regulator n=1 Tax=Enterococcus florum TaxID=2480627 RepID=A0A4P5PDJ9_9ENTE|nr:transcription repressor NadR [Enterococcus florum]GCF94118.1 transcriptional regulator [Enterococcus florum]
MKDGNKRREKILTDLAAAEKPISASRFAKEFGVSRQIIVGDVALLRASGEEIIATARGYVLEQKSTKRISKLAVQHDETQAEEELRTIVDRGAEIIDVIVEHPLYGELVGGLHIKTQQDVDNFLQNYRATEASLLSQLTDGIHLHTIAYEEPDDLAKIKQALSEKGILYEEKEA